MSPIFFYFLGFIISYVSGKLLRNYTKENEWEDVRMTLLLAIFSWVGFICILLASIAILLQPVLKKFRIKYSDKPPKWL